MKMYAVIVDGKCASDDMLAAFLTEDQADQYIEVLSDDDPDAAYIAVPVSVVVTPEVTA